MLFFRKNVDVAQLLQLDNTTLLEQSNYNKSLPTKIFAHGWVGFPDQGYTSKNGKELNKLVERSVVC